MKRLVRLLNSRRFAVYLLLLLVVILVLSSMLPSEITVTAEKWNELKSERPFVYWASTHFSTPYVVRSPLFVILSLFLFLSTLTCTGTRVIRWIKVQRSEFEKEKAFSFAVNRTLDQSHEELRRIVSDSLDKKRWKWTGAEQEGCTVIDAQKGSGMGFWGSVIFHIGLVLSFLAVPVTALTVFRGQLLITEGIPVPLRSGFISQEGRDLPSLSNVNIMVRDMKGIYHEGRYKVDFGGTVEIGKDEYPFSVNNPFFFRDLQFALHEFGYSPGILIRKEGNTVFNFFLNLRHPSSGDYFDLPDQEMKLFVLLFPDFVRDGDVLGTRSKDPNNPVLLVRFLTEGKEEIAKGLLKVGEEVKIGDYRVTFAALRNWANFVVTSDSGVPTLIIAMMVGLPGLLIRFMSNERKLEIRFSAAPSGTDIEIKGYSRYYPAFLEKEVRELADKLVKGD